MLILLVVTVLVVVAAGVYAVIAFQSAKESQAEPSAVEVTAGGKLPPAPFIAFRNTAEGQGSGEVATVPLADPGGQRALSGKSCDRVYATVQMVSCLRTKNEVPTNFEVALYDDQWQPTAS